MPFISSETGKIGTNSGQKWLQTNTVQKVFQLDTVFKGDRCSIIAANVGDIQMLPGCLFTNSAGLQISRES